MFRMHSCAIHGTMLLTGDIMGTVRQHVSLEAQEVEVPCFLGHIFSESRKWSM